MKNKYLLSLGCGVTYTLTGADASATFSPDSDQVMPHFLTSGAYNGQISLYGLSKIMITGARLTNNSVEVAGNAPLAAQLKIRLSKIVDGAESGDPFASFEMNMAKWGRWEKKNIVIVPDSSAATDANRACRFVLDDTSVFHVFDYNVQSDMVGQDVDPVLELEIEAEHVLDVTTGLVVA